MSDRIKRAVKVIEEVSEKGPWIDFKFNGATGKKVIGVLQGFSKLLSSNECYLEIGVYQGKSLISVSAYNKGILAIGIDNFSQFDIDGKNQKMVNNLINQHELINCKLINADFEDALNSIEAYLEGMKIGLYFIDGPHDYRSQIVCLLLAKKHLSEEAIIVVDNSNYNHVRQANQDFLISHPDCKLLFEAYSRSHPANLRGPELENAWNGWLDGVNIMIMDNSEVLEASLPQTIRDRTLFFNDHKIHPMRNSVFAARAVKIAAVIKPFNLFWFLAYLTKLFIEVRERKRTEIEPYLYINSYSEKQPEVRWNPSVHAILNMIVNKV
jgi:hypothetical protein